MEKRKMTIPIIGIGFALLLLIGDARAEGGRITQRSCPYSCRTEGIPKPDCRDWRQGDTCYVEDLRQRGMGGYPPAGASGTADATAACAREGAELSRPRIDVSNASASGGTFSDKVRVHGFVEGTCISEAGYYERGELIEKIPIATDRQFRRFEFEVRARADSDRRPEIRAYNVNGDRDIYSIDPGSPEERARGRYYPPEDRRSPGGAIGDAIEGMIERR